MEEKEEAKSKEKEMVALELIIACDGQINRKNCKLPLEPQGIMGREVQAALSKMLAEEGWKHIAIRSIQYEKDHQEIAYDLDSGLVLGRLEIIGRRREEGELKGLDYLAAMRRVPDYSDRV